MSAISSSVLSVGGLGNCALVDAFVALFAFCCPLLKFATLFGTPGVMSPAVRC